MFSLFQLQCFLHIYNKLQLESMVKRCHIKSFCSGLVVENFHVNRILRLTGVDPVYFSAAKSHLIPFRPKLSLFQLSGHRPHRPAHHPFDTWNHISITRRTIKDRITVIHNTLVHAFLDQFSTIRFRYFRPPFLFFLQFKSILLHCWMKYISEIQRCKAVFLSLLKPEPVSYKMCTGTSNEFLHSGYTRIPGPIELFSRLFRQWIFPFPIPARIYQPFHILFPSLIFQIPAI